MEVCNRVDGTLWQAGARHWPGYIPVVDVVISAVELTKRHNIGNAQLVYVPFPDKDDKLLDPVLFEILKSLAETVKDLMVMTVCAEGKNRSGLISVMILHARGMEIEEAIKLVRDRCSTPGGYVAISNRVFVDKLRTLKDGI